VSTWSRPLVLWGTIFLFALGGAYGLLRVVHHFMLKAQEEDEIVSLVVVVTDGMTQQPVANAHVLVTDRDPSPELPIQSPLAGVRPSLSMEGGRYLFKLPRGLLSAKGQLVRVEAHGYRTASERLSKLLTASRWGGNDAEVTILLAPDGG